MKISGLKDSIDKVINRSFNAITNLYSDKNNNTRLIFPEYTHGSQKGEKRVSEQEFRQLFVEEFNKYTNEQHIDWYYSIETPTKKKYRFSDVGKPKVNGKGVSGRFDLTIWMNDKMVAIIEFKSGNASKHDYNKDICKLANKDEGESYTLRYFINVLEDSNKKTFDNIDDKFKECKKDKATIHLWLLSMGVHRQNNRLKKEIIYK